MVALFYIIFEFLNRISILKTTNKQTNMEKTFADIRVGHKLYWGAVGMDHISDTIVTDTHLNLDGEHLPMHVKLLLRLMIASSLVFAICF